MFLAFFYNVKVLKIYSISGSMFNNMRISAVPTLRMSESLAARSRKTGHSTGITLVDEAQSMALWLGLILTEEERSGVQRALGK